MARTIVWAGDSTVARNGPATYPQTGLGQGLLPYLKPEVRLLNLAVNGRSTKSFIDEQRMPEAYFALGEGDFFFIQFGHNDEKTEDPLRGTAPFGDFSLNLEKFVNVARNRGALPVLLTPVCRRHFEGTKLIDTHWAYADAVRVTARRLDAALIDLTALSMELLRELGPERSKALYMHVKAGQFEAFPHGLEDDTHLREEGAALFAGLIAGALRGLGGPYASLLKEA